MIKVQKQKINISELSSRINSSQSQGKLDTWNLDGLDANTLEFIQIIAQESLMISLLNTFLLLAIIPIAFFPFLLFLFEFQFSDELGQILMYVLICNHFV